MEPPFQFESESVRNPTWVRCRVWLDGLTKDRDEGSEVFEIGEPVWLNRTSLVQPQDHVYWIHDFAYEGEEAWVRLTWGPPEVSPSGVATIPVRPKHLLKLPDMMRIAAEASRPIP